MACPTALAGWPAVRNVNGHDDKPPLRLREGVGRVFRDENIIALRDALWSSALDPGPRQVTRVRPFLADQFSAGAKYLLGN